MRCVRPAEMAGILQPGGRGFQEAEMISPVSGSAAWRAKWLAGKTRSTRPIPPLGTIPALSVRFHKEAEQPVKWPTARESFAPAAEIDSAEGLIDYLWANSFQALTDEFSCKVAARRPHCSPNGYATSVPGSSS